MRNRITLLIVVVMLFLLAGGVAFALGLYFDLLWFSELGKTSLFTTSLYAKSTLAAVTLLFSFLFLYLNLSHANRGPGAIQMGIPTPSGQVTMYTVPSETVRRVAGVASLLVGLFLSSREANNWDLVWRWLKRVDFGAKDPVFGRDISFFVFSLPVYDEAVRLAMILTFLAGAASIALYHFKGSLTLKGLRSFGSRGRVGFHVSMLAALFFLLLGIDAYLDRFQVLYSSHSIFHGASYADLHARLPLLTVLAAVSVISALLWIVNSITGRTRIAILSVGLYALFLVIGNIYPAIIQKFVVAPNELVRESPQIQHNIHATLHAYGLDRVQERNLSGDKGLTPADIQANAATIRSIRLWDHEPLLDAFSQIQEIRTYYDFASVDNDRYALTGGPQQVMLSGRELNSASLPERNWINEHLTYTHGYGLTLGPVNRITSEGLPVLLVQDIPPRTTVPSLKIERPEIYYGELTRGYVVVNTGDEKGKDQEFDYPSGEANVYTTYKGGGGVPIRTLIRKLLFAVYFRDPNILLSPLLNPDSRFLYHRDIATRIKRLAPFLVLDQDPYLVISNGRLFWIQDAYTVTDRYPYATPTRGVGNYVRNSVKAVLDAYNGSVDFYISDPEDAIIRVYDRIFPGIFRPLSDMPADLQTHLRYPEDIFRVQTYMYSTYHMMNPQIFYNKEDLWEIPVIGSGGGENPMAPYYTIMRLPREKQEEFILMLPFTPGRKDNLSAWMVARSDREHYGELMVYRFPKQKLVYGPKQIVARINQDAEISRQISLWDQRGSEVIQGTLLVIPIEEALLYVRPLYLRAAAGKIPELKRVIVAYENRIAMEETLEQSIARIFQGEVLPTSEPSQPGQLTTASQQAPQQGGSGATPMLRQAREIYDRAIQAQRQGDWAAYGQEIKRLGALLEQLSRQRAEPEAAAPR